MDDVREKIEKIREKVGVNSLYISRIPEKTKKEFQEFATAEFCGDYGMLLKHLFDFYKGAMLSGNEAYDVALEDLHERVTKLESTPVEEKSEKDKVLERIHKRKEALKEREEKKNGRSGKVQ